MNKPISTISNDNDTDSNFTGTTEAITAATPSAAAIPGIISTVILIAGIIATALAIAKLIDYLYDRFTGEKDKKEETDPKELELVQQQLQILQFGVLQPTKHEEDDYFGTSSRLNSDSQRMQELDADVARQLAGLWMFNVLTKMKTSISSGEGAPSVTTENAKRVAQTRTSKAPPPMVPPDELIYPQRNALIAPPSFPTLDNEIFSQMPFSTNYALSTMIDMKTFSTSQASSSPPSTSTSSLYSTKSLIHDMHHRNKRKG